MHIIFYLKNFQFDAHFNKIFSVYILRIKNEKGWRKGSGLCESVQGCCNGCTMIAMISSSFDVATSWR